MPSPVIAPLASNPSVTLFDRILISALRHSVGASTIPPFRMIRSEAFSRADPRFDERDPFLQEIIGAQSAATTHALRNIMDVAKYVGKRMNFSLP